MTNMSFAHIKTFAKISQDWSYQETDMFMSWLKRHPTVEYNVAEEIFSFQSIAKLEEYIYLFNYRPIFVTDVFSLNMLQGDKTIKTVERDLKSILGIIGKRQPISHISNQDTVTIVSKVLGRSLEINNTAITLDSGDDIIAVQNLGDDALKWILVTIR